MLCAICKLKEVEKGHEICPCCIVDLNLILMESEKVDNFSESIEKSKNLKNGDQEKQK